MNGILTPAQQKEYDKLDRAIREHENYRFYPQYTLEWISNRITWNYKFNKLPKEILGNFADRMTKIFEERI